MGDIAAVWSTIEDMQVYGHGAGSWGLAEVNDLSCQRLVCCQASSGQNRQTL
jgi:hypothetical protein